MNTVAAVIGWIVIVPVLGVLAVYGLYLLFSLIHMAIEGVRTEREIRREKEEREHTWFVTVEYAPNYTLPDSRTKETRKVIADTYADAVRQVYLEINGRYAYNITPITIIHVYDIDQYNRHVEEERDFERMRQRAELKKRCYSKELSAMDQDIGKALSDLQKELAERLWGSGIRCRRED